MLESLFNKVAGLQPSNFIKERLQVFSCEYCEIFKNTYFEKHLRTAASTYTIVTCSQKNNNMQRCFHVLEPKLHKKLACVMLFCSPQTTFHRKIIYNFVWIYLARNSRPEVICKNVVLRNIFRRKTGCFKYAW